MRGWAEVIAVRLFSGRRFARRAEKALQGIDERGNTGVMPNDSE